MSHSFFFLFSFLISKQCLSQTDLFLVSLSSKRTLEVHKKTDMWENKSSTYLSKQKLKKEQPVNKPKKVMTSCTIWNLQKEKKTDNEQSKPSSKAKKTTTKIAKLMGPMYYILIEPTPNFEENICND